MKFNKIIKEIHETNDFFNIDYEDVLENFDVDEDNDETVPVAMRLSIVNVAFLDAVRGIISRPKYLDKIISIYRKEFIEDIKNRIPEEEENFNKDT